MSKIKSYTAEEGAEQKKDELLSDYNFCKAMLEEISKYEQDIENIRTSYNKMILKYRINSVVRVLGYIRSAKITDAKELDTLLCHCQNKLAGNIDGTELELSRNGDEK